jgi:hypothetical protein
VAEVTDVDNDLRGLARRVPEDVRAHLSKTELHLRCQEAAQLVGEAEASGDDRKRAQAGRLLRAASPSAYRITMGVLGEELRQARLDGNDHRAYEIQQAMRRYDRDNPQPSPETVIAHVQAEVSRLRIPQPPAGHLWARRMNRSKNS